MKTIAKVFAHSSGPITLCIELDPSQVFPSDPGAGTPDLIVARRGGLSGRTLATASFPCGSETGELGCGDFILSEEMVRWLNSPEMDAEMSRFWLSVGVQP